MAMTKWYNLTARGLGEMSDKRLYSYYKQMSCDDNYEAISDGGNMVDVTTIKGLLIEEYIKRASK